MRISRRSETLALLAAFVAVHVALGAIGLLWAGPGEGPAGDVRAVYPMWIEQWQATGRLVGIDLPWVYPIGALPWMVGAAVAGMARYTLCWLLIVTVLDAVVAVLLARRSRPLLWWWLVFTAFLGPVALARIDSIALPFAIAGVLVVADRPAVASALFTVGAWIKVWPAALVAAVLVATRRRPAVLLGAAGASAAVLAIALLAGAHRYLFSFVAAQTGRSLQVEAPVALPWVWAALLGRAHASVYYDWHIITHEVRGTGVATVAALMTPVLVVGAAVIVGLGMLALRRGVPQGEVLAFTALGLVSALIALNKVGSPQYISWLAAPVLLGLMTAPRRFRAAAVLVLGLAALTQAIYPWGAGGVNHPEPVMVAVLTLRDLLELVVLGAAVRGLLTARAEAAPSVVPAEARAVLAPA